MTAATDPGVDFWLEYVTAEGGLHERVGAASLVVLPEDLQERHRQDAEMTVTADPDVAREDGALLMTVGHPLLTAAAESVLAQGDVGVVRLERPTSRTPDLAQLQDWARDRFPVDHGRLDLTGGPRPSVRSLLRVSSLATFAMSSDDRFQEQIECWVDVPSGRPLADGIDRRLADLVAVEHPERDQLDPHTPGLARALGAVDAEIARRAEDRRIALGDSVLPALRAERDRARDYYQQMADSLRKRMATAAPDKVAGYQSRLDHTQAERDRRLAEIEEKYRSSVQCLPFRLHLVGVPSLRVEAGIRRGNRWYPMDLEWLTPVRRFAPVACPGCGSGEILVAGKDGLGCRSCRPPRVLEPVPEPATARRPGPSAPSPKSAPSPRSAPSPKSAPPPKAAGAGAPKSAPSPKAAGAGASKKPESVGPKGAVAGRARKAEPVAPVRPRIEVGTSRGPSPAAVDRTGNKLMGRIWELVAAGDRALGRMFAPGGPAAALAHVYGTDGPRMALGLGDRIRLLHVSNSPSAPVPGTDYWLTVGELGTSDRSDHPFQVLWHLANGRPLVDEILGVANGIWPRLAWHPYRFGSGPGFWSAQLTPREIAATRDDPVAVRILDTTVDGQGIAIGARCLAAWWRLDPAFAGQLIEQCGPEAVAAALDKLVSRQASTYRRGDLDVASDYGAVPTTVKSVSARLQRRLGLGPLQPW